MSQEVLAKNLTVDDASDKYVESLRSRVVKDKITTKKYVAELVVGYAKLNEVDFLEYAGRQAKRKGV